MNEFSSIEGGRRELPLAPQGTPAASPSASDRAAVLFRDLMRKQSASDSGLSAAGAEDASQGAVANVRAPAGERDVEPSVPFTVPAELMAAGVQRGPGYLAPAAFHDHAAAAGPAQADAAQNDKVAALLQHFCANLYVGESQRPGMGHIMVDLGAALPGSSVEMTRDGVFLNVRLHAADDTMLRLMRGGSGRLLDALNKSTGLVVRLDLVQRSDAAGRES